MTLVPASPARIIGGADLAFLRLAVFDYRTGADPAGRYESLLVSRGATRAPSSTSPEVEHGFAPSDPPDERSHAWCLKDGAVSVSPADSAGFNRAIIVTWTPLPGPRGMTTPCTRDASPRTRTDRIVLLPPLAAPHGLRVAFEGSGGSDDEYEFHAATDTTWTADSLMAHYAREFINAGWTVGHILADARSGIASIHKPDDKEPWSGALSVVTGPDRRQIVVRLIHARAY